MDRRTFLKSTGVVIGVLGTGGVLAACGENAAASIPEGDPTWNVITASFPELLVGERRRFAFAVTDLENNPVDSQSIEVYTRTPDGEVTGGPYPVDAFGAGDIGLPIYRTFVDVEAEGPVELVAVEGDDFGAQIMNAVPEERSQVAIAGSEATSTATPTVDDDRGMEELCTLRPEDCSMHEHSLDEALASGVPIMMMFATPAYCQTAVCGPAVETLETVRASRDWGDIAFIHAEIFTDAGETVAEHVRDWDLPSEPWLFSIGRDGRIVARVDGPMVEAELIELAEELL
jgi:hypothetical protein